MEQYSGAMSEEMRSYNLWEEDYYGMISQGISDSNAKNNPMITNPDQLDNNNQPNADDVARSVYVVSSSETTNPGNQKRRRSRGAAAAASQSTTFLNASISNFRALVQQHTGCHNATVSPKGPITLCFANEDRRINNQY